MLEWLTPILDLFGNVSSRALTGQRPRRLTRAMATRPRSPGYEQTIYDRFPDLDKRLHAYASARMRNRFGYYPALGVGYGKELLDVPRNLSRGAPWFDWEDIDANRYGLGLAEDFGDWW